MLHELNSKNAFVEGGTIQKQAQILNKIVNYKNEFDLYVDCYNESYI